jgi:hypothetical protein
MSCSPFPFSNKNQSVNERYQDTLYESPNMTQYFTKQQGDKDLATVAVYYDGQFNNAQKNMLVASSTTSVYGKDLPYDAVIEDGERFLAATRIPCISETNQRKPGFKFT